MGEINNRLNVFVDSSVLMSAMVTSDANHNEAVKFFKKINNDNHRICVNNIVILELVKFLKQKTNLSNEAIKRNLDEFLSNENVFIYNISDIKIIDYFLEMLEDFDITMKSSDTIITITAIHFEFILVTFDRQIYSKLSGKYDYVCNNFDSFSKMINL